MFVWIERIWPLLAIGYLPIIIRGSRTHEWCKADSDSGLKHAAREPTLKCGPQ